MRPGAAGCIWLTGATGYLGSRIARKLLDGGNILRVLKRSRSSLRRLPADASIEYFDVDSDWPRHMQSSPPPSAIIHCATCYGRAGESPEQVEAANVEFASAVLESGIASGCPRFVNADTSLDSGVSPYAETKSRFREAAKARIRATSTDLVNVRLEHFFGPGDDPSKFTTHVIRSCVSGVPLLNLTPGLQRRDFIFVDDAVDAFMLLLQLPPLPGSCRNYPVGSGVAVTVREFVELVRRLSGAATHLNFGGVPYRAGELMLCEADISAMRALGWQPRHPLREALQLTIDEERKP